MRRLLAALAITLLASPVRAADETAAWFARFDVDSSTETFGVLKGKNGNPYGDAIEGKGKIKTSGSDTAVTAVDGADNPFDPLADGDVIAVRDTSGTVTLRFVSAKADADNITIDTNADWENGGAGLTWTYYKATTCTDTTCGWIDVSRFSGFTIEVGLERSDLGTGILFTVQCRGTGLGVTPKQIWPETAGTTEDLTTANAGTLPGRFVLTVNNVGYASCRLGVDADGADTADVVNASTELFDASLTGVLKGR
jgi:hypothetical protein